MSYFAWNRHAISLTNSLTDSLATCFSRTPETEHWFALIDTAFDAGRKRPFDLPAETLPIYHQGTLERLSGISPLLVPLDRNAVDPVLLTRRLLHHCDGRPMLSFIRSVATAEYLRDAWQNALEIETSDGQIFVLRFADTRITPVLAEPLLASVWGRLCGGVAEWRLIGRDCQLQELPLASTSERRDESKMPRLDDAMLAHLLQAGEADALASLLHEHVPDALANVTGADVHRILRTACAIAAENSLNAQHNVVALAIACLEKRGLHEHAALKGWLAQRHLNNDNFLDALELFLSDKS